MLEFNISEMDEWDDSNEDSSNSTEEKDNEKIKTKQKRKSLSLKAVESWSSFYAFRPISGRKKIYF